MATVQLAQVTLLHRDFVLGHVLLVAIVYSGDAGREAAAPPLERALFVYGKDDVDGVDVLDATVRIAAEFRIDKEAVLKQILTGLLEFVKDLKRRYMIHSGTFRTHLKKLYTIPFS